MVCQFFHETQWFFEVFEIPKTSSSLILLFSNTQTQWLFDFWKVGNPRNWQFFHSDFPKFLELAGITKIKDPPHTGKNSGSQTQSHGKNVSSIVLGNGQATGHYAGHAIHFHMQTIQPNRQPWAHYINTFGKSLWHTMKWLWEQERNVKVNIVGTAWECHVNIVRTSWEHENKIWDFQKICSLLVWKRN